MQNQDGDEDGGENPSIHVTEPEFWAADLDSTVTRVCAESNSIEVGNGKQRLISVSSLPFPKLLKFLSRARVTPGFDADEKRLADGSADSAIFEISSLFRWMAQTHCEIMLAGNMQMSQFDLFRKIVKLHQHRADRLFYYTEVRCRQCVARYGKEAPWNCDVCAEFWSSWTSTKPTVTLQKVHFECFDFSFANIANLVDIAFCPNRVTRRGFLHEVFALVDRADIISGTLFMRQFYERLRRIHSGTMRPIKTNEVDAQTLQGWLDVRKPFDDMKGLQYFPRLRYQHFFRINAYNRTCLAALLVASEKPLRLFDFAICLFDC
ncbi:unnamed protein product, partial [Mesorhabditis spiculigera]